MMRVIAGSVKGRKLKAPPGQETRPITDRIKEALFNVLGSDIIDTDFLDLFAGSGSVGIEALSRGARRAVFVDNSKIAVKVMKENITACKFTEQAQICEMDVFRAVNFLEQKKKNFEYIYIDPPFKNDKIFHKIMDELGETGLLSEDGILIIRTQKNKELAQQFKNLIQYRYNHYGESCLNYYRLTERSHSNGGLSHS